MSASTARYGALILLAVAIVLLVFTVTLNGNRRWLALAAVVCALAGGWVGSQGKQKRR